MKQYINKSALVAEIEKELNTTKKYSTEYVNGKKYALNKILSFLDTLEMKEVEEEPISNDLEEAATSYARKQLSNPDYPIYNDEYEMECAFEAGAQWQKEQTIYKACNYLFSHMGLFVTFFDDDIVEDIERSEFIKKFRIAMEDKL